MDFIFYQFLMKECKVFCILEPPWEIIWSCSRSKALSYFNKSTCLFKCSIEIIFFYMSFSSIGILPLHFYSSFLVGGMSCFISSVTLFKASDSLLAVTIPLFNYYIWESNSLDMALSFSIASESYFLSWIREVHCAYRFSNLVFNKS